jgi:hypothetical protein
MGLSLNQIGGLLALVLGAAARPSRRASAHFYDDLVNFAALRPLV